MKKTIKIILILSFSIILLWFAFRGVKFSELLVYLKKANYIFIIISFFIGLLAFIIRGLRWTLIIKSMGYNNKNINSINTVSSSYFFNLIFPRAGEVVRCTTMSKLENIPFDKLLGTVILERIIDLLVLFLISIIVFIIERDSILNFIEEILKLRNNNNDETSYTFVIVILLSISFLIFFFRKNILKSSLFIKVKSFLKGVTQGISSIKDINKKGYFIILTLCIWLCYFFMIYTVFFSFEEMASFSIKEAVILLLIGGLAMIVPVQGGIGAYHIAIKIALTFFGISEVLSLSFATIVHTTQTLVAIIFGGIAFIIISLNIKSIR